ncbi:MAG: transferrin-binding protein-like solute binding protein, partial [Pseudomonadota bacterium]|nr:transferrin-binding protein-like solute binding protein [Pseudomonadota bacterium]
LTSGDAAIALENSDYVAPTSGPTALGTLTQSAGSATVQVDPQAATTGWSATAITMNEYLPGTNDTANPNLGGTYNEYRDISAAAGTDYELQVWNWTDSYGAQFRDNPDGGEADRQAWLYGGTRTTTAAMPTSGTANYSGEWGGTAQSANWTGNTPINALDNNRLWMVKGTTSLAADFSAGTLTGTLTTDEWRTLDSNAVEVVDLPPADEDVFLTTTITGNTFAGASAYGSTAVQG